MILTILWIACGTAGLVTQNLHIESSQSETDTVISANLQDVGTMFWEPFNADRLYRRCRLEDTPRFSESRGGGGGGYPL